LQNRILLLNIKPRPPSTRELRPCEYPPAIPDPGIYAYPSLPKSFPSPAIGGHDLIGTNGSICYTSTSRYLPYGISNVEVEWKGVNWGELQKKCLERNSHLFSAPSADSEKEKEKENEKGKKRQAVVVRTDDLFKWRPDDFLSTRALIAELNLASGGEYEVILLIQITDDENANLSAGDLSSPAVATSLKAKYVPEEFRDIAIFYNDRVLKELYPKVGSHTLEMQAFQPIQWLALNRPEFEYFWTTGLEFKYTGHNYEFFDRIGAWARAQPREFGWERSGGFFMSGVHGDWNNYNKVVKRNTAGTGVLGPQGPPVKEGLLGKFSGWKGWKPKLELPDPVPRDWGVGEDADVISLSPIWDPVASGWIFEGTIHGYPDKTPRRASTPNFGRFSRRVLMLTHEEQVEHGSWVESSMTNPTTALHHGLKALYAPHPIYHDERIEADALYHVFNGAEPGERMQRLWHAKSYLSVTEWKDRWRRVSFSSANELSGELYRWWSGRSGAGRDPALLKVLGVGEPCFPGMALHPVGDI
jgi:Protein of unknown function (DUF3405)